MSRMTTADIIAMMNDAREIIELVSVLHAGSIVRRGATARAERIATKCEAALAAQASGHEPMVELFGDAPTAQEGSK